MTTLEAVNELLEALGDPPVTALDATTDATEAEAYLDRWLPRVLSEQAWAVLKEEEYELTVPDRQFTIGSITGGPYTYGETVTETTSAATGTYAGTYGTTLLLRYVSGTFTGDTTLTGGTSGATCTASAVSTVTEARIPVDQTNWLRVWRNRSRECKDVVPKGAWWYDLDDQTYLFTESIWVDIVALPAITDLPYGLAYYVVTKAAWAFQQYKQRGDVDEGQIEKRLALAQGQARQEDLDIRGRNVLDIAGSRRVKGDRVLLLPIGYAGASR